MNLNCLLSKFSYLVWLIWIFFKSNSFNFVVTELCHKFKCLLSHFRLMPICIKYLQSRNFKIHNNPVINNPILRQTYRSFQNTSDRSQNLQSRLVGIKRLSRLLHKSQMLNFKWYLRHQNVYIKMFLWRVVYAK